MKLLSVALDKPIRVKGVCRAGNIQETAANKECQTEADLRVFLNTIERKIDIVSFQCEAATGVPEGQYEA